MTDEELKNVQTLDRIEHIFFVNRLDEIPVSKLLHWYRTCIHESRASPQGIVIEHRNRAIRLSEAIKFELNAKMTIETQLLIQSQINQTDALTNVSKNQLEQIAAMTAASKAQLEQITALTAVSKIQLATSTAFVDEAKATNAEAKATTKISAVIASLTIVLAVETYYLDIPEVIKMGWVQALIPLAILGLFLTFLNWHLNRKEKKSKNI
jgi:hypothetical protein